MLIQSGKEPTEQECLKPASMVDLFQHIIPIEHSAGATDDMICKLSMIIVKL